MEKWRVDTRLGKQNILLVLLAHLKNDIFLELIQQRFTFPVTTSKPNGFGIIVLFYNIIA